MDISDRLRQAADYLKFKQIAKTREEIAITLNRNPTNILKAFTGNKRYLTKPFLDDFCNAYSDYINKEWLLTGEGQMQVSDKTLRPHVEAKASAGVIVGISKGEYAGEMREAVQGVPDYDFTIKTEGESMLPRIEDGDDLCCRIADDRLNPPIGKICLISTRSGNAVKVIQDVTEDSITLHSLNPAFDDYSVDVNDIIQIAQVVGLVRSFV